MSITFHVAGEIPNYSADACPDCTDTDWQNCQSCGGSGLSADYRAGRFTPPNYVNMVDRNARDVLAALGFEVDPTEESNGVLLPGDLRARCARYLEDPCGLASDLPLGGYQTTGDRGCKAIVGGRRLGYIHDQVRALLKLAERAGDRAITYG